MRKIIIACLLACMATSGLYAKNPVGIKYASQFGFLPGNSAEKNAVALQKALDGGGTVIVDVPGTYALCNTIFMESNTTLEFAAGTFVSKEVNSKGQASTYTFVNRGAYTCTYDENIRILGLHLITNGLEKGDDVPRIFGMNGYLTFYYVKNLVIDGFRMFDGAKGTYVIHVGEFEDVKVLNAHIEGWKDAVHFAKGKKFVVRDCIFKTFDDPLAFNAHDYVTYAPVLGWIEDGVVENCYDLADPERGTTGFFCRILAGAWTDWFDGMEVQQGDSVVSEGRLYRVVMAYDGKTYKSTCKPTFESGEQMLADGIKWIMLQDHDVEYTCGVRNVHFKDIYLQKPRSIAFQIHFDKDRYSRSYYPNAMPPVQENLIFENIFMQAPVRILIKSKTPVNNFKLINSMLDNSRIQLIDMGEGLHYDTTHVLLSGTTFKGDGKNVLVEVEKGRPVDVRIIGSIVEGQDFEAEVVNATVLSSDIDIKVIER